MTSGNPITLSERGYFWVGVERVKSERGTVAAGQMYVQYEVPLEVKHPYPVVMVHGGGGQGLDFLGTPDGRPGWATHFLEAGYRVYVVDRAGHGRSPYHAEVLGPMGPLPSYEAIATRFSGSRDPNNPFSHLHTQWPGSGELDDPTLDQFMGSQGPIIADFANTQRLMQAAGAELLDRIGPAILLTHSMGGAFGWVVAEARPQLVKAIVACEPIAAWAEMPHQGTVMTWGLAAIPLTYDPPVSDPAELKTVVVTPSEEGVKPYRLQAEPARRLPNLSGFPIAVVTSESSWLRQQDPGTVAYLRQAGADVEHVKLWERGIRGNGHLMMGEKNNREVAEVLFQWLASRVEAPSAVSA